MGNIVNNIHYFMNIITTKFAINLITLRFETPKTPEAAFQISAFCVCLATHKSFVNIKYYVFS